MLMCVSKVTAIIELTNEVRGELYLIWLTHIESHWAVTPSEYVPKIYLSLSADQMPDVQKCIQDECKVSKH